MTENEQIIVLLTEIRDLLRGGNSSFQWTPEGLPICPKHGDVMSKREKQGDVWYSHRVLDGHGQEHYCRGYDSKKSPGWLVGELNQSEPEAAVSQPQPEPPTEPKPSPAEGFFKVGDKVDVRGDKETKRGVIAGFGKDGRIAVKVNGQLCRVSPERVTAVALA